MSYIGEVPTAGAFYKIDDDISSTFDGIITDFTVTVDGGLTRNLGGPKNLTICINNVIQEPYESYTVSNDEISFVTAPDSGDTFWGTVMGNVFDYGMASAGGTYTKDEIDNIISDHHENFSVDHDDRYYTEAEMDVFLGDKSDDTHDHDDAYYTEGEMDTALGLKSNTNHEHTSFDYSTSISGATVFDAINVTNGIVTSVGTRNMTAADVGAATSAHQHTPYDATINTSGATVSDELTVENGIVTKADTRSMIAGDLSCYTAAQGDVRYAYKAGSGAQGFSAALLGCTSIATTGLGQIGDNFQVYKTNTYANRIFTYPRSVGNGDYMIAAVVNNDTKIRIVASGNGFADGAWQGGGADYAEYFEWSDGNSSEESRKGMTIVMDGDKVRLSVPEDSPSDIIGVVSVAPAIVGDTGELRWSGKYLRDDYGEVIDRAITVYDWVDEDGQNVSYREEEITEGNITIPVEATSEVLYEPDISPNFDPNLEYIPRSQRKEWVTIGLLGKLRINKGQIIGDRWIKMKDITENIEQWLVR